LSSTQYDDGSAWTVQWGTGSVPKAEPFGSEKKGEDAKEHVFASTSSSL